MPDFAPQSVAALTPVFSIVGTSTFDVMHGSLEEEGGEPSRELDRTPLTDNWFELGDGRFNPSTLTAEITLAATSKADAVAKLNALMAAAESVTKIVEGTRERLVFGLGSPFVKQRIPNGYRLTLTFLPKSRTWDNAGTPELA